jgi:hypothetical protein
MENPLRGGPEVKRMTTAMKIPINYAEVSETLKKFLKL